MKKSIVALVLLFVCAPLFAKQPLTTEVAAKWLDSMQAMEKWSDSHPKLVAKLREKARELGRDKGMPSFQRSVAATRAAGLTDQVQAVIAPYGFQSLESWGALGDRVMAAYMAMNLEQSHASQMIRKQLAKLDKDTSIPAEQKQAMRKQMEGMERMMQSFASAPKADIEAVRPLAKRFEEFGRKRMQHAK